MSSGNMLMAKVAALGGSAATIAQLFEVQPEEVIALLGDQVKIEAQSLPLDFLADEQVMIHGALLINLLAAASSGGKPTTEILVETFTAFLELVDQNTRFGFDGVIQLVEEVMHGKLDQRRCTTCQSLILTRDGTSGCPFTTSCKFA